MATHLGREFEKIKTWEDRAADAITTFCGKMSFVYIHITWFGLWVVVNIGLLAFVGAWDPYPFGLLTLIVSLEAIFLSTFVMISQNRTARQADLRAELDYQTDVKAEVEVEEMICMLKEIHVALGLSDPLPYNSDGTLDKAHVGARTKAIMETIHQRRALETQMAEAAEPSV